MRCLQLMRGARPKLDVNVRKYTTLAIQEVEEADVPWEIRPEGAEPVEEIETADFVDEATAEE